MPRQQARAGRGWHDAAVPDATPAGPLGSVAALTVWPVKSMAGATAVDAVAADRSGLAGDRTHAVLDRRPLRDGTVLSARGVPGLLRWSAAPGGDAPVLTAPDGRTWHWDDEGLAEVLADDLGIPVSLAPAGRYSDLVDSVLVTTQATHDTVEQRFGQPLDTRRWRTNLHLEVSVPAFAEHGWEGRTLVVGDVVLRLLHPCKRCTIPTWEPGGARRTPELLRWFHREADATFGINARVEVPGTIRAGAVVRLV